MVTEVVSKVSFEKIVNVIMMGSTVLHWHRIIYQKLRTKTPQSYYFLVSVGRESGHGLADCSAQGLPRLQSRHFHFPLVSPSKPWGFFGRTQFSAAARRLKPSAHGDSLPLVPDHVHIP